jgi:hypothetical protein
MYFPEFGSIIPGLHRKAKVKVKAEVEGRSGTAPQLQATSIQLAQTQAS